MPSTVTVLPLPAFLSAKLAEVSVKSTVSPASTPPLVSEVTVAVALPS